jgi:hypothetical protein
MSRIDCTDLVGLPYVRGGTDPAVGLDCRTLAFLVGERAGLQGLPAPDEAEDACFRWVASRRAPWKLLGCAVSDARRLGDLVLTDAKGAAAGALMLVDEEERLFVTASEARGRVCVFPARVVERAREVVGVYRWLPDSDVSR